MQSHSTLMDALSPVNEPSDLSALLKPLSALPAQAGTTDAAGKVYMALLAGQPRASIIYAVERVVTDHNTTFRPVPAAFAKIVRDHADRIQLKLKHLTEALEGLESWPDGFRPDPVKIAAPTGEGETFEKPDEHKANYGKAAFHDKPIEQTDAKDKARLAQTMALRSKVDD